jgi:REP element-mobilizing transposase RayT
MRHHNFIPASRGVRIRSRGRLPHWEVDHAVYSLTFRLKDSLPRHIAAALGAERRHLLRTASNEAERAKIDRAFALRLDHSLDSGYGSCILREDRSATIVADALRCFDGQRYDLHAWCVMPNHVHAMFYLERGRELACVLHSWKSFTAHAIGRGSIWQAEYFDRIVRGEEDFSATRAYIRANPAKAGLRNWRWKG